MKKILSIILAVITCFSFVACKNSDNTGLQDAGRRRYSGTHIFNVQDSETEYLIKNGATDYKILLPEKQTEYTNLAASELSTLFNEATGIQLQAERETGSGYTHNAEQRFISIGKTNLFESAGFEVDKILLKKEGYRIATKDKNIYLFTAYDIGNLYAAYELMEILFNFEYYYYDCYEIDSGITEKKLPILDVTDVPDFNTRINATKSIKFNTIDTNAPHRMRFSKDRYSLGLGDIENGITPVSYHNTMDILPILDGNGQPVATDEAKWHADDNNQLCYTAHGDPESYERMYKRVAYVVENCLMMYPTEVYPDIMYATVSCEDEFTACSCTACAAEESKYGAKSASIIKFLNNVMVEVRSWMELPENAAYKRDEFYLIFFAYFQYLTPPVHYDENLGKYVLNEDLEMHDDVGVMYAISDVTSTVSMYDKANDITRAQSEGWFDVAPAMYIWTYSGNTSYQAAMWPSYEHLDEDGYNFYATANAFIFHDYIDYSDKNNTGFQSLKLYIDSQMMWDCSQTIAELKDKWFNAMFGETKDIMLKLFEQELLYTSDVYDRYHARVSHGWGIVFTASDWSLSEIKSWISLIEEAHKKNEKIYKESNPEKYEMIKHHINQEFAFPALIVAVGHTVDSAGQLYNDVIKYLQANETEFLGYEINGKDCHDLWKDIVVGE